MNEHEDTLASMFFQILWADLSSGFGVLGFCACVLFLLPVACNWEVPGAAANSWQARSSSADLKISGAEMMVFVQSFVLL